MDKKNVVFAQGRVNFEDDDDGYENWLESIQNRYDAVTANHTTIYKTNAKNLFDIYLKHLPQESQNHYNCRTCKRFIEEYGNLVVIKNGIIIPIIWGPPIYENNIMFSMVESALYTTVKNSRIEGVYCNDKQRWAFPHDGTWKHIEIKPYQKHILKSNLYKPHELTATKKENYKLLSTTLSRYSLKGLTKTKSVLETINHNSKINNFIHFVDKFINLKKKIITAQNLIMRDNYMWEFVGNNNKCYIQNSVIETLIDDIEDGFYDLDTIKKRFSDKTSGINYMRPKSNNEGNIDTANKIIEKLGIEKSFERRFATINDPHKIFWATKANTSPLQSNGFFDFLKDSNKTMESNSTVDISYINFVKNVLPTTDKLFINCNKDMNFRCFTYAVHEKSPCIFKWKNHLASYIYHKLSRPSQWNLTFGWNEVIRIIDNVGENNKTFIIKGCVDTQNNNSALFPETMIPELHSIRKTVEEYSIKTKLAKINSNQYLCGVSFPCSATVRTESNGIVQNYKIINI